MEWNTCQFVAKKKKKNQTKKNNVPLLWECQRGIFSSQFNWGENLKRVLCRALDHKMSESEAVRAKKFQMAFVKYFLTFCKRITMNSLFVYIYIYSSEYSVTLILVPGKRFIFEKQIVSNLLCRKNRVTAYIERDRQKFVFFSF